MSTKSLNDQLAEAAQQGKLDEAESLIHKGADLNAVGDDELTPLLHAVDNNRHEMISMLLQKGAAVSLDTPTFGTALQVAELAIRTGPEWMDKDDERKTVSLLRPYAEAHSLAATLDAARPPESVPEAPAPVRLSNDPMNRAPREDLGAPDAKPDKPRRVRL